METRNLGRSGIQIAPLSFGGNIFGWTTDEAKSFQILDAFVEAGFNCIDTADSYSKWAPGNRGGESETILGKWFKARGNRSKIVLATKVGSQLGPDKKGLSKNYILQAAEASLKRLQTDYIDLYQSHIDDVQAPLEETLAAYQQLISQGKVRAIGASNYTGKRLQEALEISRTRQLPRYESLQPLYNLYDRADFEKDLEPVCCQHQIAVLPYFSLASGFLTGKYRSEQDLASSARSGFVKKYVNERGFRILEALDEVAKAHHSTVATVALAWLISRPSVTAPIASATSIDQLHTLTAAVQLKLDQASLDKLGEASAAT